jgi:hypothetical protein
MSDEVADLKRQVAGLVAENEKLKKQLTETRAERAEYLKYICELFPPVGPGPNPMVTLWRATPGSGHPLVPPPGNGA